MSARSSLPSHFRGSSVPRPTKIPTMDNPKIYLLCNQLTIVLRLNGPGRAPSKGFLAILPLSPVLSPVPAVPPASSSHYELKVTTRTSPLPEPLQRTTPTTSSSEPVPPECPQPLDPVPDVATSHRRNPGRRWKRPTRRQPQRAYENYSATLMIVYCVLCTPLK